jgi:hypothetical protein
MAVFLEAAKRFRTVVTDLEVKLAKFSTVMKCEIIEEFQSQFGLIQLKPNIKSDDLNRR